MLRFIAIAVGLAVLCLIITRLVRDLRSTNLDWQGIGVAIGFIALAFYLRHATGLG